MKLGKSLATWVGAAAFAVSVAGIFGGVALRADSEIVGTEPSGIEINETNFPDENFRSFVSTFDNTTDNILTQDEIKNIKYIRVAPLQNYSSIKGIEFFNCLERLTIYQSDVKIPDLSFFPKLKDLDISHIAITSLDLSANPELEQLHCYSTKIEFLDLSKNVNLKKCSCSGNELKQLIVGNNSNLRELICSMNHLESIDISKCENLEIFDCNGNNLSTLDVSNNTKIYQLSVSHNDSLASVDVRNLPEIVNLIKTANRKYSFYNNKYTCSIESMDSLNYPSNSATDMFSLRRSIIYTTTTKIIYKNPKEPGTKPVEGAVELSENNFPDEFFREYLERFDLNDDWYLDTEELGKIKAIRCSLYPISSLQGIENFTNLTVLECEYANLSKLNVSSNLALKELSCEGNSLKSLDTSNNTELKKLFCGSNDLSTIDVGKNIKLTEFDCSNNEIQTLDVSNNKELTRIGCTGNTITSLDVGNFTNLQRLDCFSCNLKELNICGCDALCRIACHDNQFKELDLRGCTIMIQLVKKSGGKCGEFYSGTDPYGFYIFDEDLKLIIYGEAPTPTAIPSPTPASSGNASIGDFAERLYTVALGRSAEKDGKNYWVTEIKSGRKTGADSALFFLTGPEFKGRGLSIEEFVETLYQTFFGRASEANGKAYWVGELKNNRKSREDVIRGFIDSTEWCNICAEYGVLPGAPSAKANKASQAASGFATRLYTCCLKRDPEKKGLDYWSLALTNREQTGSQAAKLFFESEEFKNLKTSNTEYVTRLYKTFMDRDPEADGLSYWVGELAANRKTRADVLSGFASSKEFTNICKSYGIERGTI